MAFLSPTVPLVLAEYHGFTTMEMASAMRVPEATAKTRLFRARETMRGLLGDEWSERTGRP